MESGSSVAVLGMVPGRVYGWVYRRGNTGYPATRDPSRAHPRQRSGPRKTLQGSGVGGLGCASPGPVRPSGPAPTLRARSVPLGPSLVQDLPPRAKGRDSTSFLIKLVKRTKCHQKVIKRPVIVPNLKNGSQKSPLDFPGFPIWPAFSPKELMGHF